MTTKKFTLKACDNVTHTIDEVAGNKSNLLKGLFQDYEDSEIPIPDIRGDILKIVIEYLEHYATTEPKEIIKPLPSNNLSDVTDEWDVAFLNKIDLDATFDLINAANYMDIKSLLDLSCAKIASIMKGKSAEEIRNMFSIECDLSEEELKEYEEYQI